MSCKPLNIRLSKVDKKIFHELTPTPNHCRFCKHEGHTLIDYPFIEKNVWDTMINHFQTKV
jgi:hypothetical protein